MVTGTADFQALFQGLLSEVAVVNGQPYGVPIVKLTDDSIQPSAGGGGFISGTVSVNNFPNPQIVSGSVLLLDFPTYAEWDYFGDAIYSGTNLYHGVFRRGGASGTILATVDCTYDASDNLLTVRKT